MATTNKKVQDIQLSDKQLYTQFQQYFQTSQYSDALAILTNNSQLNSKDIVAENLNALNNNLTYLEGLSDPTFKSNRIPLLETQPTMQSDGEIWWEIL